MQTIEELQQELSAAPNAKSYKVVGLTAKEDGSMPVKIAGKEIDLASASQEQLKQLFDAGKRYVQLV